MKFNLGQVLGIVDNFKIKDGYKKELIKTIMTMWWGFLGIGSLKHVGDLEFDFDIKDTFDMMIKIKTLANSTISELRTIESVLVNGSVHDNQDQPKSLITYSLDKEFIYLRDNRQEYAYDLKHLDRFINSFTYEMLIDEEKDIYRKHRDLLREMCELLDNLHYFNNTIKGD